MSYNDGWNVFGPSPPNFGWNAGPMAFDIAAIQYLYGAKTTFHSGNDTYVLQHVNGFNDRLACIWDTGGIDNIMYSGPFGCAIDLRAATLKHEPGGGGFVSYDLSDHWKAFTIAHGVVIENASGGSGPDRLIGNGLSNVLGGNFGNDTLNGLSGNDNLRGSAGSDKLIGGNGLDTLIGGFGRDSMNGGLGADNGAGNPYAAKKYYVIPKTDVGSKTHENLA